MHQNKSTLIAVASTGAAELMGVVQSTDYPIFACANNRSTMFNKGLIKIKRVTITWYA